MSPQFSWKNETAHDALVKYCSSEHEYKYKYCNFKYKYCPFEYSNYQYEYEYKYKGKGKDRTLIIAPQVDTATAEALRYMVRTKQHCTYLP